MGPGTVPHTPDVTCQADTCNAPPSNLCIDANTKRIFDGVGSCAELACDYAYRDVACTACPACEPVDLCAGVTCNTPPGPVCATPSELQTYNPAGSCREGACSYAVETTRARANEECVNGTIRAKRVCDVDTDVDASTDIASLWAGTRAGAGTGSADLQTLLWATKTGEVVVRDARELQAMELLPSSPRTLTRGQRDIAALQIHTLRGKSQAMWARQEGIATVSLGTEAEAPGRLEALHAGANIQAFAPGAPLYWASPAGLQ